MVRTLLKSKLHRARVTQADLNYVGSITISEDLMEAADILPSEKVFIVDNNNGARFETYAILGPRGEGTICLNGAAARLVQPGDEVIIMSFAQYNDDEVKSHKPRVLFMDENNGIKDMLDVETPGEYLDQIETRCIRL